MIELLQGIGLGVAFGVPSGICAARTVERAQGYGERDGLASGWGSALAALLYGGIGWLLPRDSPALATGKYSRVRPARRRFAVGSGNRPPGLPPKGASLGERRAKIWQLLFGRFAAGAHQPQHAGYSKRRRCRPSHGAGFGCRSAGLDRRRRVDWHDGVARRLTQGWNPRRGREVLQRQNRKTLAKWLRIWYYN